MRSSTPLINWQKRDPIRNSFVLPNEMFQLDLSAGAKLVYTSLRYHEDRKTYQCHPSYRTIGKETGMSVNTVRKYVEELVDKGLVTTENTTIVTKDGRRQNGTLRYTIRPIQEAVDRFHERQMEMLDASVERQRAQARLMEDASNTRQQPSVTDNDTGGDEEQPA